MFSSLSSLFSGARRQGSDGAGPNGDARRTRYPHDVEDVVEDVSTSNGSVYPPQRTPTSSEVMQQQQQQTAGPAPRAKQTMARIKHIVRKINPELLDTLSYPASKQAIAELQAALRDYLLPRDVLEAYQVHDGQDSFSVPRMGDNAEVEGSNGFIYGLWWMPIEEIIEEYYFWRRLDISTPPSPVNTKRIGADKKGKRRENSHARAPSTDAYLFGSEMDPRTVRGRMRSCPNNWVREEYSHPSWLPLLKDGYGNYIGVDLDPPQLSQADLPPNAPRGILPGRGQIIAFGREIDTKTVLWNGWADQSEHDANAGGGWARFLASYADDLSATSANGRLDARRRMNGDTYEDEDDESQYRSVSGGRQETPPARRIAGLEWMDDSPQFESMGTIEALVERSKMSWASVGLYSSDQDDSLPPQFMPYGARSSTRPPKPAPLKIPDFSKPVQQLNDGNDAKPEEETEATPVADSASHFIANGSNSIEGNDFVDIDPATSTTALVPQAPHSPEPSVILSPPSPKTANHILANISVDSSNTYFSRSEDPNASPRNGPYSSQSDSLQSPANISPSQATRMADRQRRLSSDSLPAPTPTRRSRKPPPPVASLGLPTLEFGNGIWNNEDTEYQVGESSHGFEVIVDKR